MICVHLESVEVALKANSIPETYRGSPWSKNCREWVYYDCVLDPGLLIEKFALDNCVGRHANEDPKSGRELGIFCECCQDAIIGIHPLDGEGKVCFPSPCAG